MTNEEGEITEIGNAFRKLADEIKIAADELEALGEPPVVAEDASE